MAWQEGDVHLDGVKIHYYRRGSGRPLVLSHGATDNGLCWTRVAQALERDYDLIAYDARYHGLSDAPEEPFGGGGADLIGLVERLGLEHPSIMGHSMGAGTMAQAAADRPDLFRCAILEDPGWRMPVEGDDPSSARPPPPDYPAMTLAEVEAAGRERNPMWHDDEFGPWAQSKLQCRRELAFRSGPPVPGVWRETVRRLTLPTLLITGSSERGAIVTPEAAAEAQHLSPTIEVVQLEQAGHNIRREAFDEFMQVLTGFLARH